MKIFFNQNSSIGSLSAINNKLKNYLEEHSFIIEPNLYNGGDVSISNFVSRIHNSDYFFKKFSKNILIQPVDGSRIRRSSINDINKFDLIITPSTFGKNILLNSGVVKPIEVIPNHYEDVILHKKTNSDKIIFYHESTGIGRKNINGMIKVFLETFDNDTYKHRVKLIIKTPVQIQIVESQLIEQIVGHVDGSDLIDIWSEIDCYISLSHAEGFGIPLLNFAYFQKPIITLKSEISGYMDFLNESNSYLIKAKKIPIEENFLIFEGQWENYESIENAKDILLEFLNDYENDNLKIVNKKELERFSYNSVMGLYLKHINEIFNPLQIRKKEFPVNINIDLTITTGIQEGDGLGKNGYGFIKAINGKPINYIVKDINGGDIDEDVLKTYANPPSMYGRNILETSIPMTPQDFGILNYADSNIKLWRYSVFEATELPQWWIKYLTNEKLSGIFVPSEFCKRVFDKSGLNIPIHVATSGVETNGVETNKFNDDVFTFAITAQAEERKNHLQLIEAFKMAFPTNQKVRLKVHARWGHLCDAIERVCKTDSRIEFIKGKMPLPEFHEWWKDIDCYVLCSSGEGFSMTPRESLIREIPTLISSWGAHETLVNAGVVEYVDPVELVPSYKHIFNHNSNNPGYIGEHASYSTTDITNKLLYVYDNFDAAREKAVAGRKWVMENETWEKGLDVISSVIKEHEYTEKAYNVLSNCWTTYGKKVPYWSVLTQPEFLNPNEEVIGDFYESGNWELNYAKEVFEKYSFQSLKGKTILDFGCGLGRITRTLLELGGNVIGMDISESHLNLAKKNIKENIKWVHNKSLHKTIVELCGTKLDLIITFIVLQHNRPKLMRQYIKSLLEALNDGGVAILHIPYEIPNYNESLEAENPEVMEMHCLPITDVENLVKSSNCRIVDIDYKHDKCGGDIKNCIYIITK